MSTWQQSPGSWRVFNSENNKCQKVKLQQEGSSTRTAGCQCYHSNISSHVQALISTTTSSHTQCIQPEELFTAVKINSCSESLEQHIWLSKCWWGNSREIPEKKPGAGLTCLVDHGCIGTHLGHIWQPCFGAALRWHMQLPLWFLGTAWMRQHWEFD